jgi:chemotaxis signal transduction protein
MNLEFIVFKMENRYFGIESSEVLRVLEFENIRECPLLTGDEKQVYANTLLEYTGDFTYQRSLIIQSREGPRCIFHIPNIDDFLVINEIDIIPVPDLIKKQQHPFIVWGVSEQKNTMIVLMTLDFYFE